MNQTDAMGVVPPVTAQSAWLRRAIWARWILLACYICATGTWYYFAFTPPDDPLSLGVDHPLLFAFLIVSGILFGLQVLLLLGAPQRRWPRPRRRKSIFASLVAGSAIAALLSVGIVLSLRSLYQLVYTPSWFTVTVTPGPATAPAPQPLLWIADVPLALIGTLLAAWTFWFLIFALVGGGEWPRRFGRMYRLLIAGTVLELLITIPIDVQVRKRTNCYCGEGTFFSLIIGLTAILWVFGPGIAILFFIRRRQRLQQSGCCLQCGYNLHGLTSDRCPECGRLFRRGVA